MATKYHRMAAKMPKLDFSVEGSGGGTAGGDDESWVAAQRALKTLTPLSRVHLTLEDGRTKTGTSSAARYKLTVVDRRVKVRKKPLAAFIVPLGREHEWMFSSEEGQNQLTADAGFSRLAIVTMQRGQAYDSLEQVKAELSPLVPQLMPDEPMPDSIPFLSLGDDIGSVTVVFKGTSDLSGELFVEDVEGVDDEGTLRRLVFGSNRNLIQSEARLVAASPPVTDPQDAAIDQTYLSNEHHHSIVGAFSLLAEQLMPATKMNHAHALIVGLGGGSLAMFLHEHFATMKLAAVELDGSIVSVAEQWFGFTTDRTRLAVHVADGIDFVERLAESLDPAAVEARKAQQQRASTLADGPAPAPASAPALAPEPEPEPEPEPQSHAVAATDWMEVSRSQCHYDAIVIDVDTKDSSLGMSCPPAVFLAPAYVQALYDCLTKPQGVLIVNIVARSDSLYAEAIAAIAAVFPVVLEMAVEEDVNRIVVAMTVKRTGVSSSGLVKSTMELHEAAGAAWGPTNPNAMWTEEVTSAASTALRSAKIVASDGKVAPTVRGQAQGGQQQAQQKKAAPGGGKKKSTKKKSKKKR